MTKLMLANAFVILFGTLIVVSLSPSLFADEIYLTACLNKICECGTKISGLCPNQDKLECKQCRCRFAQCVL